MIGAGSITCFGGADQSRSCSLQELLTKAEQSRGGRSLAFTPERMEVVVRFADVLARDLTFRDFPALRAFAFWIRKSAITRLHLDFTARLPANCVALGRGIAFHVPPANVDTIFLYSWVVAFLTGNVNITRLPSSLSRPVEHALTALLELLRDGGFSDMFVFYPPSDPINRALSHIADLRFVWGGDAKVAAFETLPLRTGGRSLVFPDRTSCTVIDGAYLASLDDRAREALARRLYNDIFVFDQMACSSPHLIYVVGRSTTHAAYIEHLVGEVDRVAHASGTIIGPSHDIEKLAAAMQLAAEGAVVQVQRFSPETTLVELAPAAAVLPRVGGGFLSIFYIAALDDLADRISERTQTLGYAGFTRETMDAFARIVGMRGLCRVVPIGQALNFDVVWDGHDLLHDSVRLIRVS
jgi:hypothetical protein